MKYTWLSLGSRRAFTTLEKAIPRRYDPVRVTAQLRDWLSDSVKGVLIERDHTDDDFLSEYNGYYRSRWIWQKPKVVRVHFFDGAVSFDPSSYLSCASSEQLDAHYFGHITLVPTRSQTIGASLVTPAIRKGLKASIITARHSIALLGHTLTIQGFPSMDQRKHVSTCAHVGCWAILRHYETTNRGDRRVLSYEIAQRAGVFERDNRVPTDGLVSEKVTQILTQGKRAPVLLVRGEIGPHLFFQSLCAFIESGWPLYAISGAHAVVIVGLGWHEPRPGRIPDLRYANEEIESLVANDDTSLPYTTLPRNLGSASNRGQMVRSIEDINGFIVCLPNNFHHSVNSVAERIKSLFLLGARLALPAINETLVRYLFSDVASLAKFMLNAESTLDSRVRYMISLLPEAHVLLLVEFTTAPGWDNGFVYARAVLDVSTDRSGMIPLIVFYTPKQCLCQSDHNRYKQDSDLKLFHFFGTKQMALPRYEHEKLSR